MIKGFANILIADITAGQINHYFAEIAPCTVYPLYGMMLAHCNLKTLHVYSAGYRTFPKF